MDNKHSYVNILGITIVLFILCLVALFCLPEWLFEQFPFYKYKDTGPIGDSIGGIAGPIVALIASVLTFFAFKVQYDANRQQRVDLAKERFENKFFEMLKLQKENVNEMEIEGYDTIISEKIINDYTNPPVNETLREHITILIKGRDVFESMYKEFFACYEICRNSLHAEAFEDKENYILELSYKLFFNGASSPLIHSQNKALASDSEYVNRCKNQLKSAASQHIRSRGQNYVYQIPLSNITVNISIKYPPFIGHVKRLGHYYRHLFLMVKYVAQQPKELIDYSEKREYLRILRAQVSSFEQLMLYFNYLAGYGRKWENTKNHFFTDYRMIHNIPLELTEMIRSAKLEFKDAMERIEEAGEQMFEYDEA